MQSATREKMRCTSREIVYASPEDVCSMFRCEATTGLSSEEAARRLREDYGPNELEQDVPDHPCVKFAAQLKEPLILLLFASAIISLCLGQYDDALSIALAVLIVTFVAFVQEVRSEESLKALASLVPHKANVLRDGTLTTQLAKELVPGDVVEILAGARIPADCRIIECVEFLVDESSLSGESEPVTKVEESRERPDKAHQNGARSPRSPSSLLLPVSECETTVFMGTFARGGRCRGVVVCTGGQTEFGRAAAEMKELEAQRSPLQQGMDELGKRLSFASICVIVAIGIAGVLRGERLLDVFTIGVSLAVAAIPEGLPICVAVTLALGVIRMARRNAVVKRLPAVESLGCTDILCVDKTGTLTMNEMALSEVWCPPVVRGGDKHRELRLRRRREDGGEKFCLVVENREYSAHVLPSPICRAVDAACICSNATLGGDEDGHGGVGLPTEVAVLEAARDLGVDDRRSQLRRIHEVPFSSDRKRMDVTVQGEGTFVKGAFEAIKPTLFYYSNENVASPMDENVKGMIRDAMQELSSRGLRVVTVAQTATPASATPRTKTSLYETTDVDVATDSLSLRRMPDKTPTRVAFEEEERAPPLVFLGLLALSDPARPSALEAVSALKDRGVKIIMLTGDGRDTARAIARDVGILSENRNLDASGEDVDQWVEQGELSDRMSQGVSVVYRVSPRHKLEVVRAMQRRGSVVAMTGDGVNDAPALRAADVGVAMGGGRGTDVAMEAADVVLTDDDILSIVAAVDEGKGIFHNIRNFITFQLSTSFAALSLVAVSHLLDLPIPLNAMQVLWINIIMDGPPSQSLGCEDVDPAIKFYPPRPRTEAVVTSRMFSRVLTSALLICFGTLAMFVTHLDETSSAPNGTASPRASTMTFTTFVFFDMFNALSCRSDRHIVCTKNLPLFTNRPFCFAVGGSILGQIAVIYWAPLRAVFQTEPLSLRDLASIVAVASTVLVLDIARKLHMYGAKNLVVFDSISPRSMSSSTKGNRGGWRWRTRLFGRFVYAAGSVEKGGAIGAKRKSEMNGVDGHIV